MCLYLQEVKYIYIYIVIRIRIALIGFGFFGGNFQLSLSSVTITIASPDLHGPSCLLPKTHYYKYIKIIILK